MRTRKVSPDEPRPSRPDPPPLADGSSKKLEAKLKATETEYRAAHRAETDRVSGLSFARYSVQRAQTAGEDAKTQLDEARYRDQRAGRAAHEARRDVQDGRQRGVPPAKCETAVRRAEGDARRAAQSVKRAQDVARRTDLQRQTAEADLQKWSAETDRRVRRAHNLRTQVKELSVLRDIARSREKAMADEKPTQRLSVTERAVFALKDLLDRMVHDRNQALRLNPDSPDGGPTLAIDNVIDGDHIVTQDEQPILLIDSNVSERLEGATLDVDETPEGSGFSSSYGPPLRPLPNFLRPGGANSPLKLPAKRPRPPPSETC